MTGNELLEELFGLLRQKLPDMDFYLAYRAQPVSRRLARPAVYGETDLESVSLEQSRVRLRLTLFFPDVEGPERGEGLFAAIQDTVRESYPGFSGISREAVSADRVTGLLSLSCFLEFSWTGDSPGPSGLAVRLGGKEYSVSGVKLLLASQGEELVSVGETIPFALRGGETVYTVELEGIQTAGLERLAEFTAELGGAAPAVYTGCRWKSLAETARKAVFTAKMREDTGGVDCVDADMISRHAEKGWS